MNSTNFKARIIAKTQSTFDDPTNLEEYIAFVARVSNPNNQMNNETSGKLLRYLIKNKHWSPFEMASMTIEIHTTRDIGRQILRHRSFSFQEFSGRYAAYNLTDFKPRQARLQDKKNRQNSIVTDDVQLEIWFSEQQQKVFETAGKVYAEALELGIAKEQARAVLPEGLTPTTMYMAGTVRSWIHYVAERTKGGVQLEHRQIAMAIADLLKGELPSILDLVDELKDKEEK